jgi:omega-6 fatty acid desaturase (delta-12 desaturase)
MAITRYPTQQTDDFKKFLQRINSVEGVRLADAFPKDIYEIRLGRGLLGLFASYTLYIASVIGVYYAPHWLFYIPLWLLAGLGGWGLFCIAHDCGHNSFSKSRTFNHIIGQVVLFPLLYPFHGWRHMHNLHHANTNNLETDTDWRPVLPEQYLRMGLWEKFVYHSTRSWLFWLGTVNYQRHSGFRPEMFPKLEARNDTRRSILITGLFAAIYLPTLIYFTGWSGFFLYFLGPWLGIHAWFSTTTMMHHVHEQLPFLTNEHWKLNGSRMLMTIDYRYSKIIHFFTHNISVHAAHHVAPIIPFYNLPRAQEALKQAFPGMIYEKDFSWAEVWKVITTCHLYDAKTGYYLPFSAAKSAVSEAQAGEAAVGTAGHE